MTPDAESRIRTAFAELADAVVAAVRAEAPVAGAPERLLSIDQAAELLGVGRTRVYAELASGRLRSVTAGRRRLVPSSAIRDFVGTP